jgi:hypothetical protein
VSLIYKSQADLLYILVLVTSDAIESGEKLRLRLSDSDRFSADDSLGTVEVDLASLVDETYTTSDQLRRRRDPLKADKPGMKHAGTLDWSIRFCKLWQMSPEDMQKRMDKVKKERPGEPVVIEQSWWIEKLISFMEGQPSWVGPRTEKRKETVAWFTGERERDEMEAGVKPDEDLHAGILQVSAKPETQNDTDERI